MSASDEQEDDSDWTTDDEDQGERAHVGGPSACTQPHACARTHVHTPYARVLFESPNGTETALRPC
jgi:hypothetical protein